MRVREKDGAWLVEVSVKRIITREKQPSAVKTIEREAKQIKHEIEQLVASYLDWRRKEQGGKLPAPRVRRLTPGRGHARIDS